MRVVPAIDLLHGQVVRGVAGRRSEYRPVASVLCSDSAPRSVATAFSRSLGLEYVYIADLDAIAGREPNWAAYEAIADAGLELLIDAGLQSAAQAQSLLDFLSSKQRGAGQGSLIAGLESVHSPRLLSELLAPVGSQRLIFSLDLKAGQPLTSSLDWPCETSELILEAALERGVERFLMLDLSRVGVDAGVGTEALCKWLRTLAPHIEIMAGGGVRGIADLHHLASVGCNGVLVASALHDGRLDRTALAEFGA
jgi:phosphoribosylformimino-5-aminoimidazole carboxamide ribotide isomerase